MTRFENIDSMMMFEMRMCSMCMMWRARFSNLSAS